MPDAAREGPDRRSATPAPWAVRREIGAEWQMRGLVWLALHAPARVSDALLWAISLWFAAMPGRPENAASRAYLARVLGRPPRFRDVHAHAFTFARAAFDRVRLLTGGAEAMRITVEGEEAVHRALAASRGAILLGAHFGSFEALRALERALPGLRVRYLMHPDHASASHALLGRLNPEVAARVIPLRSGPNAMLAAVEALQRGEFVAFLGDRLPDLATRAQTGVSFLGGTMAVPTSPYHAALAAQVPLILCFAPRLGKDRYAVHFSELHDGAPVPRAERRALVAGMARTYAARLEALCRRHPFNWFNFFDVWSG